jgi:hypothetical protein
MNEFQATAVMLALFALRCVLPLAITVALGYLMNRLVDRWEAEDAKEAGVDMPAQIPPIPVTAVSTPAKPASKMPCWLVKGCNPAQRADCPAFQQRGKPCWVARLQMEGIMPADCPDCPVYQHAHA